jgi:invasion protein IalB
MVTAKQPLMFLVVVGLGIACARAQMPQRTTATYDDWTISCTTASGGERSCELVQSQIIQGQATPASQITIARSSKGGPFMIFFQVPPKVWLQTGVKLQTDDKDPGITATFRWCTPTRCLADADLPDAAIKKLNQFADPGHLSWKDASQQDVNVPVSFKGFSPAVNAMNDGQASSPSVGKR